MDKVIFLNIIGCLPKQFDSHAFIRKFSEKYPRQYRLLIEKYGKVTMAHCIIGSFLRNNTRSLGIEYKGKTKSGNVSGKQSSCALWNKD